MAGFIKISRDILEWQWYDDANTFRVFVHLLLNANFEDKAYRGIDIKRGSCIIGRHQLAEDLGLSEQNVRTALNHLKSTNEITIKVTSKFSIVTICDFERWQGTDALTNQQISQQPNQQLTSNQPATNQQLTTPEEIKKERKIENNNIIIPPIAPPKGLSEDAEEKLLGKIAELEKMHDAAVREMSSRQAELERENAELKKKIEDAKKADTELDMSIVAEEMLPVVQEWLAYKRQKRQSYKPRGFVGFYKKLMKDCGGSVAVAKEMLEYSIANNYDGLFKPKGSYRRYELPGQVMRGEKREYNEQNFFEK